MCGHLCTVVSKKVGLDRQFSPVCATVSHWCDVLVMNEQSNKGMDGQRIIQDTWALIKVFPWRRRNDSNTQYFFSIPHDQAATVVQIWDGIICRGTEQEGKINGKPIFCTFSIFKIYTGICVFTNIHVNSVCTNATENREKQPRYLCVLWCFDIRPNVRTNVKTEDSLLH